MIKLNFNYLDKSGLDVLIIHKLREYVEFLPQELVSKVYLLDMKHE
jgi:hypothetical protein